MDSKVVAALDIGTCNINIIVGSAGRQNNMLAYNKSPSIGFKRGLVLDVQACAKSIGLAVEQAKKVSGVDIDDIFVGFSGAEVISKNVTSALQLPEPQQEITDRHLELIIKNCQAKIHNDFKCIHLIPRDFAVNGHWGVDVLLGTVADRLEMEAHLVPVQNSTIQGLYQALTLVEITPTEFFYTPLVVADQLLTRVEKEIGIMLLDIGGASTDLCWYHRGKPWLTLSLPVGGEHITSDLAIGLRIPMMEANQIKTNFCINQPADRYLEISDSLTNQSKRVPVQIVKKIIEARLLEFTDLIQATIANYGRGIMPKELVLVGGGAQMGGIAEFFSNQLNLPVRTNGEDYHRDNGNGVAPLLNYCIARIQQRQPDSQPFLNKLKSGLKSVIHMFNN